MMEAPKVGIACKLACELSLLFRESPQLPMPQLWGRMLS